MQSCLFRGHVRHRRMSPAHQFRYSTSWAYLDLAETETLIASNRLLSRRRFAPAAFRREDHLGDPGVSLCEAVRKLVAEKTGHRHGGPIRLLTQFSHFGIYFSPVNVFYCFDTDENLITMVAEVSNTPWNQKHCYVLWDGNRTPGSADRYSHPKEFHVSPFMGMDTQYEWRIRPPDDRLSLALGCRRDGEHLFQADLRLQRYPLSEGQLARSLLRRPVAAAHVIGAIYYQALRLRIKRCQFFPHPDSASAANTRQNSSMDANSSTDPKPFPRRDRQATNCPASLHVRQDQILPSPANATPPGKPASANHVLSDQA